VEDGRGETTSSSTIGGRMVVQSDDHLENERGSVFEGDDRLAAPKAGSPRNLQQGQDFLCRAARIEQEATKVCDCASATPFGNIGRHGHGSPDELVAERGALR